MYGTSAKCSVSSCVHVALLEGFEVTENKINSKCCIDGVLSKVIPTQHSLGREMGGKFTAQSVAHSIRVLPPSRTIQWGTAAGA
jgi:hypothetical protein